jgi:hypothetical protein
VQDQPVVRVAAEFLRNACLEAAFHREHVLAGREAGAVGDPEDVRVDRDRRLPERGVEHDVRRLATHARQALQGLARFGHPPAVLALDDRGRGDQVLRLAAVEPDGAHVGNQSVDAECGNRGGRVRDPEQLLRGLVDTLVGGLRGQHDRDQQFERAREAELGRRVRVRERESCEDCAPCLRGHRDFGGGGAGTSPAPIFASRSRRAGSVAASQASSRSSA